MRFLFLIRCETGGGGSGGARREESSAGGWRNVEILRGEEGGGERGRRR